MIVTTKYFMRRIAQHLAMIQSAAANGQLWIKVVLKQPC